MRLLVLCLLSLSFLADQSDDDSFFSSYIHQGLPKEVQLEWKNACYVQINTGKFYQALFLVSKDSFKTSNECYLFEIIEEGFSYTRLTFTNNEAIVCLTTIEEDSLAPLKIILQLNKGKILYSWGGNENWSRNPYIVKEYELKVGKKFPIIKIDMPHGDWTNDDKNKIIVINWWATSCIPCVQEIPGLNKLVEKFGHKDVEFIAIVWDRENHRTFITQHSYLYTQCYGDEKITSLLGKVFPRNLIIDKRGIIVYNTTGGHKEKYVELEKIIRRMM